MAPRDMIDIQSFTWTVVEYRDEDLPRPREVGIFAAEHAQANCAWNFLPRKPRNGPQPSDEEDDEAEPG